jgi:hypothetical protein
MEKSMKTQYWILIVAVMAGACYYFWTQKQVAVATDEVKAAKISQSAAETASKAAASDAAALKATADRAIAALQADNAAKDAHIASLTAQRVQVEGATQVKQAAIPSETAVQVAVDTRSLLSLADADVSVSGDSLLFTLPGARTNLAALTEGQKNAQLVTVSDSQIVDYKQKLFDLDATAKQVEAEHAKETDYWNANARYLQTQIAEGVAEVKQQKAQKWRSRLRWFGIGAGVALVAVESRR